jgi:hypothetical protein
VIAGRIDRRAQAAALGSDGGLRYASPPDGLLAGAAATFDLNSAAADV